MLHASVPVSPCHVQPLYSSIAPKKRACGRLEEELRRVREEGGGDLRRAREEVANLTDEVASLEIRNLIPET